jgi:hypothetical protein
VRVVHVCRKPLAEGSVAKNLLVHGAGGINIDGSRVTSASMPVPTRAPGWDSYNRTNAEQGYRPKDYAQGDAMYQPHGAGRWPANLVLQHRPYCRQVDSEWDCSPLCSAHDLDQQAEGVSRFFKSVGVVS